MQIERINVRSPRVSGPGQLWEPLHWCSRGQRAPAQTSVKDELGAPSRAVKNPLKIFIFLMQIQAFFVVFGGLLEVEGQEGSSNSSWEGGLMLKFLLTQLLYLCHSQRSDVRFYLSNHLLKITHPPSHLYLIPSQCSHIHPPPHLDILHLISMLFPPSSPVTALVWPPLHLNAPSFLKHAPRPSEFQQVTQTILCLTSTSTSTSCLGGLGGGSWVLKAAVFKSLEPD